MVDIYSGIFYVQRGRGTARIFGKIFAIKIKNLLGLHQFHTQSVMRIPKQSGDRGTLVLCDV